MQDGVADVLAQRASLDRGAGSGLLVSLLLHAGLAGAAFYAATHATAPVPARMVNIQFANIAPSTPAPAAAPARPRPAAPKPAEEVTPRIAEPKPRIDEPKPAVAEAPKKVEKNTVPLDAFGRSTKKGSETPAPAKPAVTPPSAVPTPGPPGPVGGAATPEVRVGGSGVTGLEGGDFPYTLYINGMHRRIGTNWFRPPVSGGNATVVYFRIHRDGSITDIRVETSSGNATFDRAAVGAVRTSSPLTPLPFGYNGNYLGVFLTFR